MTDYNRRNYWAMSVTVPIQYKDVIKQAAAARGVSVSRLVCDVLGRELGLDLELNGTLPGLRKDQPAGDQ